MSNGTTRNLQHVTHYGQTALEDEDYTGPVPVNFTFNSPVGLCMDHHQQIWVCDTGNNRIVIFNHHLTHILRILHSPAPGSSGEGAIDFRLPFHLCPHPDKKLMYITDMGNARVVTMKYGDNSFSFDATFGNKKSAGFVPLMDPNGITVVRQKDGQCHIHVNDEFFRTNDDDPRNRCVRFNENGKYVDEFRTVIDPEGIHHDLYWPQGLSSDADGNLYIANTGNYEILKCPSTGPIGKNYCIQASEPVIPHTFGPPNGIGMLGIMRYVNVIGQRVYVPDHVVNTISVLDLNGAPLTSISGVRPTWNHNKQQIDSASDPLYYAMEDAALINPYAICQGEAPDIFLISEPFCSRILKVKIDKLTRPATPLTIITAIGGRRDETGKRDRPGQHGHDSQFNCVTAVISLQRNRTGEACDDFDATAELPNYWRNNPLQRWYMRVGQTLTRQYEHWYGPWSRHMPKPKEALESIRLNLDAGNWEIKSYQEDGKAFCPAPNQLTGYFLPGNLAMAVYHPHKPLLGQICPGSPILLVSNFNLGTVSLYQVGPLGNLLNYGVPFGMLGTGDGCLSGPQGMAVSCDGEVFVVDALNHRLSKWQILQTGQVAFIRNFVWKNGELNPDGSPRLFTPTDVAISADNRIFVTDQFNNRICVFDREGRPLHCQGEKGYWEEGEPEGDRFMLPTSVAIDGKHLIVNDLVNRALKIFDIDGEKLHFNSGISLFKRSIDEGGVWMPFFLYAQDRQVFVADSTYNVVQVFEY